jgi:hypothetical protein
MMMQTKGLTTQTPGKAPATFETVWAALQETDRLVQELTLSQKEPMPYSGVGGRMMAMK